VTLSDNVSSLNKNVDGLRADVQDERRTRRWQAIAVVGLIVVGVLINAGWLIKVRTDDCKQSNTARTAIAEAFNQYTDALIAASGPSTDPARQERIDRFRADLEHRLVKLKPRDCSVWSVSAAGRS
jgi:hypothetical protein